MAIPNDDEAARAAIERELEALHGECKAGTASCPMLRALQLCFLHNLAPPSWLRAQYLQQFHQVSEGHTLSWDTAFGTYWPPRTRLTTVRRRASLLKRVHGAAFALLRRDPRRGINKILFDEVGEGLHMSGSQAERLYYVAVKEEGMPSLAKLKASGSIAGIHGKAEDKTATA